jgi:hypothetical protein
MVKSLLLMVKLPRIHNKYHQRFYTKNYPTLPNHSPSFALDLLKDPKQIEDFHGRSGLPRKISRTQHLRLEAVHSAGQPGLWARPIRQRRRWIKCWTSLRPRGDEGGIFSIESMM